jgi:hypothetical protein
MNSAGRLVFLTFPRSSTGPNWYYRAPFRSLRKRLARGAPFPRARDFVPKDAHETSPLLSLLTFASATLGATACGGESTVPMPRPDETTGEPGKSRERRWILPLTGPPEAREEQPAPGAPPPGGRGASASAAAGRSGSVRQGSAGGAAAEAASGAAQEGGHRRGGPRRAAADRAGAKAIFPARWVARRPLVLAVGMSLWEAACFDPDDRIETPPEPRCPASALSTKARMPARPKIPTIDAGDADDGDGALATRVVFAVIGDYGLDGQNEARVADLVSSWNPDFVITTGDNNYFQGAASTIDQNIGKHYCQFIGNYLGRPGEGSLINRFWPTPGNHDWLTQELRPYLDYFTLPGNERYYDVARGLVHLYALDSDWSEVDGVSENSPQASWLREKLAVSTACFDVVYFHHPPYSSGPHGSSYEMRWPFEAWGADAVMAGHDHLYERFEVGQIPYFTVGLGGSSMYDFVTVLPETRMQYSAEFGATRVTANRTGMTFEFINVSGAVIDTFTYAKECPRL